MKADRSAERSRACRRALATIALLATVGGRAAVVAIPVAPEGLGDGQTQYHITRLFGFDPFEAMPVEDINFPVSTRGCGAGRLEITALLDLQGHAEESLSRCQGSRSNPPPICEEGTSEVHFDLDDPVYGCTAGEDCNWIDFDSWVEPDTCSESRGAILVQNIFPPQEPRLVAYGNSLAPEVVVELGDPIPDGGGATFTTLVSAAAAGHYVAFSGGGAGGVAGVYLYDTLLDTFTTIVDDQDPRPRATGNFTSASSLAALIDPDDGLTIAWTDAQGAYVAPADGSSAPIQPAATSDPYAAGRQLKGSFNEIGFWRGTDRLVFRAFSHAFGYGVYSASAASPGVIVRHADDEVAAPGLGGNFTNCQRPSAADELVVFECFGPTFLLEGIFADPDLADGPVEPVVRRDQVVTLPGIGQRTVQSVATNESSLFDRGLAGILTYFTDGSSAVLLARQPLLLADHEENDLDQWSGTFPP